MMSLCTVVGLYRERGGGGEVGRVRKECTCVCDAEGSRNVQCRKG